MILFNPELSAEDVASRMHAESLGDDNIMGLAGDLYHPTCEEVAEVVQDVFAIDWGGRKSFSTTRVLDLVEGEFQGIQFLGKYWRIEEYMSSGGLVSVPIPYRPFKETFLRLLYPEYGGLGATQSWLRALGNYLDAAGNHVAERWLQGYLEFLEELLDEVPDAWPPHFQRMVSRDYSNVGVDVPRPRRLIYEQWRDLVLLDMAEYRRCWKGEEEATSSLALRIGREVKRVRLAQEERGVTEG